MADKQSGMDKGQNPISGFLSIFFASDVRRAVSLNVGWMMFDRIFRLGLGTLIIISMARYLGPEQFGQYNFAISVIGIFAAISGLGIHEILVKEIAGAKINPGNVIGAGLFAAALAGFFGAVLVGILAVSAMRADETFLLVAVLSFTLVLKATDPIRAFFEAQIRSKITILAELAVFGLMVCARITLLLTQADLMAFVWLLVIEAGLTALALAFVFVAYADAKVQFFNHAKLAAKLAKDAFPLMLAGLGVMLYMRIDQVMLGTLSDQTNVGLYAAAVRISELWYFVPVAVTASLFPQMVAVKDSNPQAYEKLLVRLYMGMWAISLLAIGAILIFGPSLMALLYGAQFAAAAPILSIHIFGGLFVALGSVRGKWLLTEGLNKFVAVSVFLGATVNILANAILIPLEGTIGAAKATVLAYGFAVVIAPLFYQPARKCISHMFFLGIPQGKLGSTK